MKIRNGFISNSSSSSYIVLGIRCESDFDFDQTIKELKSIYENSSDKNKLHFGDERDYVDFFFNNEYHLLNLSDYSDYSNDYKDLELGYYKWKAGELTESDIVSLYEKINTFYGDDDELEEHERISMCLTEHTGLKWTIVSSHRVIGIDLYDEYEEQYSDLKVGPVDFDEINKNIENLKKYLDKEIKIISGTAYTY